MELFIYRRPDGVSIRLLDNAPPFMPPRSMPARRADLRPGGLGLRFIRELMDEVIYLPRMDSEGTLLEMFKRATP